MNKWEKIRFHYYVNQDAIEETYPECLCYAIPITKIDTFTPIEMNVYDLIKTYNLPLLPQYPILNYFVDFGDPIKKIAIEVDSIKYHINFKKDRVRQNEIEKEGWCFYRILCGNTYLPFDEYFKQVTGIESLDSSKNEIDNFIEKNINFNSDCLILYLREKIYIREFNKIKISYNFTHTSKIIKSVFKRIIQKQKRRAEWYNELNKINNDQ